MRWISQAPVDRLARGDERALAALVEQTIEGARRLAAVLLSDEEVEEACSEAYLMALDRADELPSGASSQAWICELVLAVALRRLSWTEYELLEHASLLAELERIMPGWRLAEVLGVSLEELTGRLGPERAEEPEGRTHSQTGLPVGSSPGVLAANLLEVARPRPAQDSVHWLLCPSPQA